MDAQEMLSHVDHTLLKQTATWEEIQQVCEEAIQYHTATAMVPSAFIPRIRAKYGTKLKIATKPRKSQERCASQNRQLPEVRIRVRAWRLLGKLNLFGLMLAHGFLSFPVRWHGAM